MIRQRIRPFLRALGRWALRLALAGLLFLLVLELAYRNQWIDTYRSALQALNAPADLEEDPKGRRTIMVLGDSFSAISGGWVDGLRAAMPGHRVLNCAVTGTGVVQAGIIAAKRIPQYKPDILIYQIYVGNDLADYRYPISWSRLSPLRNVYWWWAHRFRSIAWLNQSLGQVAGSPSPSELAPVFTAPFSPAAYTPREKLLLQAEPGLIEHQAFLRGGREGDMTGYLRRLDEILALCEAQGTVPYLLVVPHCAQVAPVHRQRMEALGAQFSPAFHTRADYPFVNRLAGHCGTRATVLNPLEALQGAEATGASLFYNNDPHFNMEGHRFLGAWVRTAMMAAAPPDAM